jgi:hypothetical protein
METRYIILARYAEFTPDGKLNVIGGDQNQLVAESYPYVHPLMLAAARVVFDREDGGREHDFRSVLAAEDTGETIAEGAYGTIPEFVFPPGVDRLGTGLILSFRDVIFPKEGRYIVKLMIDGEEIAKVVLRVAPIAYYQGLTKPSTEQAAEG